MIRVQIVGRLSYLFSEARTRPILEGDSSDDFVAIASFILQTGSSLPVFIPAIATNQDDSNHTAYVLRDKNLMS